MFRLFAIMSKIELCKLRTNIDGDGNIFELPLNFKMVSPPQSFDARCKFLRSQHFLSPCRMRNRYHTRFFSKNFIEKHQPHYGQMHVHCASQNSFNIIHFNSTSKLLKFPPIHSEILEHTINGTFSCIDGIPLDSHVTVV